MIVPGYIAGTTNPFFLGDPTMWDLIVNINPQSASNERPSSRGYDPLRRGELRWSARNKQEEKNSTSGKLLRKFTALSSEAIFYNKIRRALSRGVKDSHLRKSFQLYVIRL